MDDRDTEARFAVADARTDTKFAEIRGDINTTLAEFRTDMQSSLAALAGRIDATNAKLDTVIAYTAGIKSTIVVTGIGSAIAVAGLVAAMLAYGSQLFGVGMDLGTVADAAARRAVEQALAVRSASGTEPTTPPAEPSGQAP
jgi:hypothetical protein